METRENVKEGLELILMSSFNIKQGASTPDLIVAEFRNGCRQMDLASACVLHPLNRLVLDFKVGARGPEVYRTRDGREGW